MFHHPLFLVCGSNIGVFVLLLKSSRQCVAFITYILTTYASANKRVKAIFEKRFSQSGMHLFDLFAPGSQIIPA